MIFGTGVVGTNAAKMAVGLGANVTVFGRGLDRIRYLDDVFEGKIRTLVSNPIAIEEVIQDADLIISGVLITGANNPCGIGAAIAKSFAKV